MIRFSLAGIPVTVRPSFWIIAGLLGFGLEGPEMIAAWVAIVFVSVLAHELGHAVTARRFGASVAITLTTLGGLTSWQAPEGRVSPGRRAAIAAAGSAVGIVLGLAVLGLYRALRPPGPAFAQIVNMVVWVNVGWGVLNWLPIRPLDGGHLLTSLLELVAPRRATRIADGIFLVASLLALAAALFFRFPFVAILAAFMAWSEVSRHIGPRSSAPGPAVFTYDEPEPDSDGGQAPEPDPAPEADDGRG